MTRPGARLNAAVWRLAVGLLALVVAGFWTSAVASATPESDADAAITAAWEATGADGGSLGPRQGDVHAVGSGFVQDFASGKMFFTPATGAHFMQGAILEKYESLGGPADSDLGFPTIDEGPGRAQDSRNSTFSAPDNPVIFWTPDNGAHVVRGAINAAWDKVGGSAGTLGVPTDDESFDGDMSTQKFTGGEISWNRKTKAFTTVPPELADQLAGLEVPTDPASAIAAARRAAGGPMGPLGAKDGDQYPIGGDGVGQNFAGGKIFYSPATGANAITGQLLEKYESVGGPEGDLGFPTASEAEGGLGPNSRISTFAATDNPVIFWTPDYGAVIVRGAMKAAWDKLGGAKGELGAPMADQTEDGNVVTQRFSGGAISWDREANKFTTEPSKLASQLSGLEVPGLDQPAGAPPASDAGTDTAKPFSWHWSWWWLIAVIPVLLLAGLVVGAALWHRRRTRDDGGDFEHDPFEDGYDDGSYHDPHYDTHGYRDDGYRDDEFADDRGVEPHGYGPADAYAAGEATTTRFTGPGEESAAGAESPYDGPTDTAIPVSQWAAPHGAGGGYGAPGDEDEPPEDSAQLVGAGPDFGGHQRDDVFEDDDDFDGDFEGDDFEDDLDGDDFEDGDFDDEENLDTPIDAEFEEVAEGGYVDSVDDVEAELVDEELSDTGALSGAADGAGMGASAPHAFSGLGGLPVQSFQDNVDTAPTRVITEAEAYSSEAHSGRHAAIELDEVPTVTAIHLPLDDPYRAPEGYPIKADTKSGRYWSPDSGEYDDAVAEIWFASEEFARTNGFVRAD